MTSITLNRPTNKQEEYEFLEKIAAMLKGGGTYLEELFTPEMVAAMQGRIRNDFHCNLYADYREGAAICDKLEEDIRDKDRVVAETKSFADSAIQNKNQIIQQMQETINKFENRYTESRESLASLLSDTEKLASALSDRELECCQLKAKLYDLEHK